MNIFSVWYILQIMIEIFNHLAKHNAIFFIRKKRHLGFTGHQCEQIRSGDQLFNYCSLPVKLAPLSNIKKRKIMRSGSMYALEEPSCIVCDKMYIDFVLPHISSFITNLD